MKKEHNMRIPCNPVDGETFLTLITAPKGKKFIEVKYRLHINQTVTVVGYML